MSNSYQQWCAVNYLLICACLAPVLEDEISHLCVQMREGEAPSFFNPHEASQLVELLEAFLKEQQQSNRTPKIGPRDVNVIATYRKQVRAAEIAMQTYVYSQSLHSPQKMQQELHWMCCWLRARGILWICHCSYHQWNEILDSNTEVLWWQSLYLSSYRKSALDLFAPKYSDAASTCHPYYCAIHVFQNFLHEQNLQNRTSDLHARHLASFLNLGIINKRWRLETKRPSETNAYCRPSWKCVGAEDQAASQG